MGAIYGRHNWQEINSTAPHLVHALDLGDKGGGVSLGSEGYSFVRAHVQVCAVNHRRNTRDGNPVFDVLVGDEGWNGLEFMCYRTKRNAAVNVRMSHNLVGYWVNLYLSSVMTVVGFEVLKGVEE